MSRHKRHFLSCILAPGAIMHNVLSAQLHFATTSPQRRCTSPSLHRCCCGHHSIPPSRHHSRPPSPPHRAAAFATEHRIPNTEHRTSNTNLSEGRRPRRPRCAEVGRAGPVRRVGGGKVAVRRLVIAARRPLPLWQRCAMHRACPARSHARQHERSPRAGLPT